MVVGALTSFVWEVGSLADTTTLAPVTVGLLASTLTIIVVSLATQKISPVPGHIVAVLEETAKVGPIPKHLLAVSDFALSPEAEQIESILDHRREEP
jgi:sodium/proline symporter